MSEKKPFSNPAFQTQSQHSVIKEFNLAPQVNNFNAVFDTKPLDEKDSQLLETPGRQLSSWQSLRCGIGVQSHRP